MKELNTWKKYVQPEGKNNSLHLKYLCGIYGQFLEAVACGPTVALYSSYTVHSNNIFLHILTTEC